MQYYAFDQEHASRYGVPEAIILHHLLFWISKNLSNGTNIRDGRCWTYNSVRAFTIQFPFWTESQIRRTLKSLEAQGAIVVGRYSDNAMDRTTWYSVNPDLLPATERELLSSKCCEARSDAFDENNKCNLRKNKMDVAKIQDDIYVTNTNKQIYKKPVSKDTVKKDGDAALFGAPVKNTETVPPEIFDEGGVCGNPTPGQGTEAECGAGPGETSAAPAKPGKTPTPNPLPQALTPDVVVEKWNAVCVSLPKVKAMTETRKAHVRKRLAEFGKDVAAQLATVEALFETVEESDFLCGRSSSWKANFDWLFGSPNNWVKVMEGNYENRAPAAQPQARNPQKRGMTILEAYNAVDDFVARNGGLPGFEGANLSGHGPDAGMEQTAGFLPSGDYIGE